MMEAEQINGSVNRRRSRRPGQASNGFTLLELMIVISIIIILVGIGVGMYQRSIQGARESVLKEDLQTMRQAIDNYTLDKQQAPQSLQDLVDGHYLRSVPVDPVCRQEWVVHFSDTVISPDQSGSGIDDVHSACEGTGQSDQRPYSEW
ncbi:MAG TPA: prepilin-type N-terminal cleavage/methylation domain-containing protein [Candidatus Saccharimonadales bacterium]|nr:prepilin-type N-terminal cleavage/methylation domain-containing protein [Candidatus Saccharimonadales bacterium]